MDRSGCHGMERAGNASKRGCLMPFKLEFYDRFGGAVAKLKWSSANQAKEVDPADATLRLLEVVRPVRARFPTGGAGTTALRGVSWRTGRLIWRRRRATCNSSSWRRRWVSTSSTRRSTPPATARDRDYVGDLYWAYMQRARPIGVGLLDQPDRRRAERMPSAARHSANVRAAFDQSGEFQ